MNKFYNTSLATDITLLGQFLAQEKCDEIEKNNLTSFSNADFIYPYTNELISLYYAKNLEDKKVLSVTSSGDHILHAVLGGCTNITAFDINRFCKYFSALKIAMIRRYNYTKFMEKFKYLTNLLGNQYFYQINFYTKTKGLLKILTEVSPYLSNEELFFWFNYVKLGARSIRKHEWCEQLSSNEYTYSFVENNAWTREEEFWRLKSNLANCTISYIDSDISSLYKKNSEKFDVIYLSNILERAFEGRTNLLLNLRKNLNNNGIIYNYSFYSFSPIFLNSKKLISNFDIESTELMNSDTVYKVIKK